MVLTLIRHAVCDGSFMYIFFKKGFLIYRWKIFEVELKMDAPEEKCGSSPDTEQSDESIQPEKTYVRNMCAKGKSGEKKRYFKQGYRRKRKKKPDSIDLGVNVVFKSRGGEVGKESLYVGKILSKDTDSYVVQSLACDSRKCTVSEQDDPVPIEKLVLKTSDLKKGMTVLTAWQIVTDFVQVIPTQVVEVVEPDYVWVKPSGQRCVKEHVDNVISISNANQVIEEDIAEMTVSHEQLNIVGLMLRATQHELQKLTQTYNTTLHQLENKTQGNVKLTEEKQKLQMLYDKSLKTVEEYRQELMTSIKTNQDINTLTDLLSKQKEILDKHERQIIAMDSTIRELLMAYQAQTIELKELQQENAKLRKTIDNLSKGSQHLHTLIPGHGGLQVMKPSTNKTRPTSFLPISIPNFNNPSSTASRQTLKRRAQQLGQVRLHVVTEVASL